MSEQAADPVAVGFRRRTDRAWPTRFDQLRRGQLVRLPGTYPAQGDTWLLSSVMRQRDLATGRRVLDVCTGTGALALEAHAAGAGSVTAVDLSARSVLSARLNARIQRADVRVLRGDLFAPVAGLRFDLIVCNPPYVPASADELPRHTIARCWDAGTDGRAVLDRICTQAPAFLSESGTLLITHSAVVDVDVTLARLGAAGLEAVVAARREQAFGPVMRGRAQMLSDRGLIRPGQQREELVVVEARRTVAPAVEQAHPLTMESR